MSDPGVNTWGRSPDTRGWLLQLSRAAACNVTSAWRALSGVSLSACSGLSVSGASVLAWLVRSRMCGTRRGRRKPDDATAGALESFGKATLHGQGRALAYTSRSLGRCGLAGIASWRVDITVRGTSRVTEWKARRARGEAGGGPTVTRQLLHSGPAQAARRPGPRAGTATHAGGPGCSSSELQLLYANAFMKM